MNPDYLLYLCATVCFVLSALEVPVKINLFYLGWAFLAASLLL